MNVSEINRRFKPEWITNEVDDDCINLCEDLAKSMVDSEISSSFLRNIFGELRRIEAGGFETHRAEFVLLRPKLAYTCSRAGNRNDSSKEDLKALRELYEKSAQYVSNAHGFKNIVNIMEAIIAFHNAHSER